MNMRIARDSVRFRISKEEYQTLERGEALEERIRFPGAGAPELVFSVRAGAGAPALAYDSFQLLFEVPAAALAKLWASAGSREPGFELSASVGEGRVFRAVLEIDLFSVKGKKKASGK